MDVHFPPSRTFGRRSSLLSPASSTTMLDNQAFGWLKTAITRGSLSPITGSTPTENRAAIESCSDVPTLITGAASDFAVLKHPQIPSDPRMDGDSNSTVSLEAQPFDITHRLDRLKTLLYEERSSSTSAFLARGSLPNYNWVPSVATATFKSFTSDHLLYELIEKLPLLPFEARKSTSAIFNYLLVCGLDGADARQFAGVSTAFAGYVLDRAEGILVSLVRGHDCATGGVDVALLCGSMLRSCLRHGAIYRWISSDPQCERLVYPFLDVYVHNPNFDVSSDALETVRVMLTGASSEFVSDTTMEGADGTNTEVHRQAMEGIASKFLNRNYTHIIDHRINKKCLASESNYMTRRMSLQLLSTILLNRSNYDIMIRYISSSPNLVVIMCLLRDPSPHITLDAFQVFKIFVANPAKPPEVIKILFDNKVKLVKYLEGLHKEREKSDEQFRDEKELVVRTLERLELLENENTDECD